MNQTGVLSTGSRRQALRNRSFMGIGNPGVLEGTESPRLRESRHQAVSLVGSQVPVKVDDGPIAVTLQGGSSQGHEEPAFLVLGGLRPPRPPCAAQVVLHSLARTASTRFWKTRSASALS